MSNHTSIKNSSAFETHDHSHCASTALTAAEATCAEQGLRLTPIRRRVLEHLLAAHRALGAYDLLDLLEKEGAPQKPPAVYRALAFLVDNGFAHRLEHRKAYMACNLPGAPHSASVLFCRTCERVEETSLGSNGGPLDQSAAAIGFKIERTVVEAEGICADCQSRDPAECS